MSRELLIAQYETKRLILLSTYLQKPEKVDPALAFAYQHRIAPVFHEDIARETYGIDPFDEIYFVKREFVNKVLEYIDSLWRAKDFESLGFYKLEEKFGGYQSNRIELIYIIEYARISRRFDDEVYAAIEKNAPLEANQLDSDFPPDEVDLG